MRKFETRVLAAVLAGAVGAFVLTASFGAHADTPPATQPVAVVRVAVPPDAGWLAEPVAVSSEVDHRAARPA
ncbi:hypothetical protein [Amycolatopsis sp. NPDC051903]|uniref:hypothetical protein n=1 Tax=Amycolatopsis sp. NPDC051903 TaxID=3363936 RepID=UPI00378B6E69